jgi:phosphoheptose isomerase
VAISRSRFSSRFHPRAHRDMTTAEAALLSAPPKFPAERVDGQGSYCDRYFAEAARAARSIDRGQLDAASTVLLDAYCRGAVVFACGNGGSASIANHLQCDHTKGIRAATDLSPRVVSLSTNVELLTAIANDIGYEDVFVYQLQPHGRPGDVLVAISSSGRSGNIVHAMRWARDNSLHTIALTGFDGGEARSLAEVSIHVQSTNYGVIEDTHQAVMHAFAQYIRQSRMTADAISTHTF